MPETESARPCILVIDDERDLLENLSDRLRAAGCEVETAMDGEVGLRMIEGRSYDTVLLDLRLPRRGGLSLLREVRTRNIEATIVVLTAHGSVDLAVGAMREGAYDFLQKPIRPEQLQQVLGRALERSRLRARESAWRAQWGEHRPRFIGRAAKVSALLDMARRAAASLATILLLGESGTGKEVLAKLIHDWSARRENPFVAVNCMAIPDMLIESELFGHEKGAFTGAERQKRGRFELARGGSLFLDEIGSTSLSFQNKLLRVLQEGLFERVGALGPIRADVRIIAASNRDLEAAVRAGQFLPDLFYRLNVIPMLLPPLRERRDDIPELVAFFLAKYTEETKRAGLSFSAEALACLEAYDWPGNVRELENVVERAVTLSTNVVIEPEELPPAVAEALVATAPGTIPKYHRLVDDARRRILQEALAEAGGSQTHAAELLGLQRTYLARLVAKHGIRRS